MFSIKGIIFIGLFALCSAKAFKHPKYGYFLLLALIIFKPIVFEKIPDIYTSMHAPLLLGVVLLLACFLTGRIAVFDKRLIKPFGALTLFVITCWVSRLNDHMGISHKYLDEVINAWILFVIGTSVLKTYEDCKKLHRFFTVSFVFISIYSYYNYRILGWEMPLPSNYYVDRNEFASSLASIVPLYIFTCITAQDKKSWYFGVFGIVLLIVCIIPSYSRGAFLSLLCAFLLSSKLIYNRKKYFIILLLLVSVGLLRVSDSFKERISSTADYNEEGSAAGRIATYIAAIDMFKHSPLLGVGVGNYNELFWDYCPEEYRKFCRPGKSVHNIYLQALSETGVIGFSSLLLFVFTLLASFVKSLMFKSRSSTDCAKLCYAFGASCSVGLFSYLFLPGVYFNFIYLLTPTVASMNLILNQQGTKISD